MKRTLPTNSCDSGATQFSRMIQHVREVSVLRHPGPVSHSRSHLLRSSIRALIAALLVGSGGAGAGSGSLRDSHDDRVGISECLRCTSDPGGRYAHYSQREWRRVEFLRHEKKRWRKIQQYYMAYVMNSWKSKHHLDE